jgi:DNA-binding MarR family transcriptional regulator
MNDVTTTTRLGQFIQSLHAVEARLEAAVEPLGLSLAKFGVLAQLAAAGEPLPLSTLAERRACVRSNITQLIDRLEADGLVKRSDDPRDRRSVRAELTAEGQTRYEAGLKTLSAAERDLFAPLGNPQRDQLLELLAALRPPR